MDCPHIIRVRPQRHLWDSSCSEHLEWLKQNDISRFRWKWTDNGYTDLTLLFRFENENDKLLFALRWA